jgi:hypothetical protein
MPPLDVGLQSCASFVAQSRIGKRSPPARQSTAMNAMNKAARRQDLEIFRNRDLGRSEVGR